jgi:hypothetical protein
MKAGSDRKTAAVPFQASPRFLMARRSMTTLRTDRPPRSEHLGRGTQVGAWQTIGACVPLNTLSSARPGSGDRPRSPRFGYPRKWTLSDSCCSQRAIPSELCVRTLPDTARLIEPPPVIRARTCVRVRGRSAITARSL